MCILAAMKFVWGLLWRVIQFTSTNIADQTTFWKIWARCYGRYNDDTWSLLLEGYFFIHIIKKRDVLGPSVYSAPNEKKQR